LTLRPRDVLVHRGASTETCPSHGRPSLVRVVPLGKSDEAFRGLLRCQVALAVGYATSRRVLGPYVDARENPILASAGVGDGPCRQYASES
jgi:hypothetical protein